MTRRRPTHCALVALLLAWAGPAIAQHQHHGHAAPDTTATPPAPRTAPARAAAPHAGHEAHAGHAMPAMYGPYAMTREASGTAWQPDATPHAGYHVMRGAWSLMAHGFADLVADFQGGPRGGDDVFSANMGMMMATKWRRGPARLGFRLMMSAEPWTIGDGGYPLLLQTGETLIDAQHPHDLFMETAISFSVSDATRSAFVYLGLPGEPALGPPAFMHRLSGATLPESPITHHWLDSTHITFGVMTGGLTWGGWKAEASAFRGREPDQIREDIEKAWQDSHAFRLSWNPSPVWSLQASHGRIESPERLEPDVDVDRTTASAMVQRTFRGGPWQTTLAWGRNRKRPGPSLDGWLLESAATWSGRHTVSGRAEWVEKDELFDETDPRAGRVFEVGKLAAGYALDAFHTERLVGGPGVSASVALVPGSLEDEYGSLPLSAMAFVRVALR